MSATEIAGIRIFLQSKIKNSKIKRITGLHAIKENTEFKTTKSEVNIGVIAKKKSDAMLTNFPIKEKASITVCPSVKTRIITNKVSAHCLNFGTNASTIKNMMV